MIKVINIKDINFVELLQNKMLSPGLVITFDNDKTETRKDKKYIQTC